MTRAKGAASEGEEVKKVTALRDLVCAISTDGEGKGDSGQQDWRGHVENAGWASSLDRLSPDGHPEQEAQG